MLSFVHTRDSFFEKWIDPMSKVFPKYKTVKCQCTHRINRLDCIVLDLAPVNIEVSGGDQSLHTDESNSDCKGSCLPNLLGGVSRAIAHDTSKAQLCYDRLEFVNCFRHCVLIIVHDEPIRCTFS